MRPKLDLKALAEIDKMRMILQIPESDRHQLFAIDKLSTFLLGGAAVDLAADARKGRLDGRPHRRDRSHRDLLHHGPPDEGARRRYPLLHLAAELAGQTTVRTICGLLLSNFESKTGFK